MEASLPHRVAITGLGAVTALGAGWPATREALARGDTAFAPAGEALAEVADRPLALVRDLNAFREAFPAVRPPLPARDARMVATAAREALADAGLVVDAPRWDVAVMADRAWEPAVTARLLEPVVEAGPQKTRPLLFSQSVANAAIGLTASLLHTRGPNLQTMGGGALSLAYRAVRRGEVAAALWVGFEELEANLVLAFADNGFVSPEVPLGEGAVALALEPTSTPRGYAWLRAVQRRAGSDASTCGLGPPPAEAVAECVDAALAEAGCSARALATWIGSDNGLPALAAAERDGVTRAGRPDLAPSSLKRQLGETLGMAAAASVAFAADRIRHGAAGPVLVTHVDFEAQVTAIVLDGWPR